MRSVVKRLRSLWRDLQRWSAIDADMHEEMRFHIEMEAERLGRRYGLSTVEAERRAYVAFGGVEKYKEEGRDTRRWRRIDALRFDARLGLRMLAKYPALTVVGGLAIAVAIAICATFFEVTSQMLQTAMPIEEGERVVALQRIALDDFESWSTGLSTLQQVSAFRSVRHNLASGDTAPEPLKVAEMTASGFALARTAPALGRRAWPARLRRPRACSAEAAARPERSRRSRERGACPRRSRGRDRRRSPRRRRRRCTAPAPAWRTLPSLVSGRAAGAAGVRRDRRPPTWRCQAPSPASRRPRQPSGRPGRTARRRSPPPAQRR